MATKKASTKETTVAELAAEIYRGSSSDGEIMVFFDGNAESVGCRGGFDGDEIEVQVGMSDEESYGGPDARAVTVGSLQLSEMPGCCGVAILHNLESSAKGGGNLIIAAVKEYIEVGLILATVRDDNKESVALADKHGTRLMTFMNPNSGNTLHLYGYITGGGQMPKARSTTRRRR